MPRPFDIDTFEPVEAPWQSVQEWIPDEDPNLDCCNRPRGDAPPAVDDSHQHSVWKPPELVLDDGRVLVFDP